jgi:hypothetical protein
VRNAGLLAVVGAAALLAGCGTARVVPHAAPSAHAAPVTEIGSHRTPQQRAATDAAHILAAFIPPPRAVRTVRSHASLLAQAPTQPFSSDVVIRTGWWVVAGQPQDVLALIQARKPLGFTGGGTGSETAPSAEMWYTQFSLPDVPGVLLNRVLLAAVQADGPDRTAIRVDAEVMWVPAKPAAELIPAVAVVTITPVPGGVPPAKADHQMTITDRALSARIAAAVNALPLYPQVDFIECGPGPGPGMRLTFRATATGPVLAVVTAYKELCPLVQVVTGGKTMPPLDGAETLFQRVMAIAGFHWRDFPAPGPTAPSNSN